MKTRAYRAGLHVLVLAVLAVCCGGCMLAALKAERGSGKVITESRDVSGFTRIDLSGVGLLDITQGEPAALRIEAEDNVMPRLKSEVRGGTLALSFKSNIRKKQIVPTKKIIFHVTVPDLESVSISGAGEIQCKHLKSARLELDLSGSSRVDMGLDVDALELDSSGASTTTLRGRADNQSVDLSGSGAYLAEDLTGKSADIQISGAGRARVNVSDTLSVDVSGSGNVQYRGAPRITQDISGAGKISRMEE